MNSRLHESTRRLGLTFSHVAEVGVWIPEASNVLGYIEEGIRTALVEPDPDCVARIRERFDGLPNVQVHPVAIFTERTRLSLYHAESSTFAAVLPSSPALVNDRYQRTDDKKFDVDAVPFSDVDDGTIDLLSVDTEGCEWFVLQTLRSRPTVISLETHGRRYRNPYLAEIESWMKREGYRVWYRDRSDTVYVREGVVRHPRWMFWR